MLEAPASYEFRNSISLIFFATQMQRKRLRCICVARTQQAKALNMGKSWIYIQDFPNYLHYALNVQTHTLESTFLQRRTSRLNFLTERL